MKLLFNRVKGTRDAVLVAEQSIELEFEAFDRVFGGLVVTNDSYRDFVPWVKLVLRQYTLGRNVGLAKPDESANALLDLKVQRQFWR